MKQRKKFIRIALTAAVFVIAIYAFTVIWSPQNINRLFENTQRQSATLHSGKLLDELNKGPAPIVTFEALQHIDDRHVNIDAFPEKSKFVDGVDIEHMINMTYKYCKVARQESDKFIYEFVSDVAIGSRGQRCVRLVTAADGTVITLYPIYEVEEPYRAAA